MFAKGRTFWALIRAFLWRALNVVMLVSRKLLLAPLAAVSSERPRRSELAQFVADHVFGNVHFDMLATVVNHEGHVEKLGNDRASTGPRLDRIDSSRLTLLLHFEKQLWIDERAFLATTGHESSVGCLQVTVDSSAAVISITYAA